VAACHVVEFSINQLRQSGGYRIITLYPCDEHLVIVAVEGAFMRDLYIPLSERR
jgi:hypothetical protein